MSKRKAETDTVIPTADLLKLIEKEAGKAFKKNPGTVLDYYVDANPKLWYSSGIPTLDLALAGGFAGGMAVMVGGK